MINLNRITDGGFTEGPILFSSKDLNNPTTSKVFKKLLSFDIDSIKSYSKILISLCQSDIDSITKPSLLKNIKKESFSEENILESSDDVNITQNKGFNDLKDLLNAGLLTKKEFEKITKVQSEDNLKRNSSSNTTQNLKTKGKNLIQMIK